MDAWELLLENSELASTGFDAWEHLNAQEGGGLIPGGSITLIDGLEIEVQALDIDVEFDKDIEFEIEVDNEPIEIEINNDITIEVDI